MGHVVTPEVHVVGDPPLVEDLAYRQFVNPMDLRVVDRTCGDCHSDLCADLESSLHGTTAGHISDGFYEMGLVDEPGSKYGIFDVSSLDVVAGEIDELQGS